MLSTVRKYLEKRRKKREWERSGPRSELRLRELLECECARPSHNQDTEIITWAWERYTRLVKTSRTFVSLASNPKLPHKLRELAANEAFAIIEGTSMLPCALKEVAHDDRSQEEQNDRFANQLATIRAARGLRQEIKDKAFEIAVTRLNEKNKKHFERFFTSPVPTSVGLGN